MTRDRSHRADNGTLTCVEDNQLCANKVMCTMACEVNYCVRTKNIPDIVNIHHIKVSSEKGHMFRQIKGIMSLVLVTSKSRIAYLKAKIIKEHC